MGLLLQKQQQETKLLKPFNFLEKEAISSEISKFLPQIPPEFNGKDYLTFLLHIDAELEHSLMVQYLYAAYSLGGDHIAEDRRTLVKGWQEVILGIAKEEMGHFVSVQNVLRVIGAPLNFNRQDFPWDSKLYPFEFKLQPLTKASLAKYIYAESPKDWLTSTAGDNDEVKEIKKEIKALLPQKDLGDPISALFDQIINLLEDEELIPDEVFMGETYPYQAKFDEWGRGYAGGARGNSTQANPQGAPNVLVEPVFARTDTISVIKEIAEQGESPTQEGNALSHFERFLSIYKVWRTIPDFNPARNIATNPTDDTVNAGEDKDRLITDDITACWANLFNVRYRMLLSYLTHSFLLADGSNNIKTPRGVIIHATFGEMYNLRSIANVLVQLPMGDRTDKMAGPPFLLPYTMDLPSGEINRWKTHLNLLAASARLVDQLIELKDQSYGTYLHSLRDADNQLKEMAIKIISATV